MAEVIEEINDQETHPENNDGEDTIVDPAQFAQDSLKEKFPDDVSVDSRDRFSGLMVTPDRLLEISRFIRDELGFNYLSCVTGIDLLPENKMEVVYHTFSTEKGGGPLVMKVQIDRDEPQLPSVVPVWPGADYQEREIWDLFGIHFEDHPDLRRILMWEGFEGHPLRKDWQEPFFEDDNKPFGSRWPGGDVTRAEENNPYGKNVQYPDGWTPEGVEFEVDTELYAGMTITREATPGLKTDKVTVNLGPQHPSTHGVFRMVVTLDGETVVDLKPVMGYLHRNHEKIGERNTFLMNIPYTDRLDYICSMSNNHGYVLGVEELLEAKVPERAEWLRILMVELTRWVNHAWALGFLLNDLGALQTPMLYLYIERELVLDFFEAVAGSRMMCNYMRFGGVAYDLPDNIRDQSTMAFIDELINDRLPRAMEQLDTYITNNEIVRTRCIGVGQLSAEDAIAYSTAGPVLRASGVPYDVRRAQPYSYYDQLDFDVAVRYNGDVYDRYLVRIDEMYQSLKILRQVLGHVQETDGAPIFSGKPQYAVRVKGGDVYGRVENPKGELGYYMTAKPRASNPDRYHIRAPSFINLTPMGRMLKGHKVADIVAVLGSIDTVLGEVDR
jgi:NADH-quinone oxidoreductase subunit D/NADH-quinone oxidoreductase subunit C/D